MANAFEHHDVQRGAGTLYGVPQTTLLNEEQWRFVQQRYHMTPREMEVAKLVCSGLSNEEIAEAIRIRYGTVKTHIRNIYRRIHVKSKVAMLLRFVEDSKDIGQKQ